MIGGQLDVICAWPQEVYDSSTHFPEEWFYEAVTWGRSDSGETVNAVTALGHGPVWQAVNILAGDMGQLPLHVMRKDTRGAQIHDETHKVDVLLNQQPNTWQTPQMWRETMMHWSLLWGNGISWIARTSDGIQLVPLLPDRTGYEEVDTGEYLIYTEFEPGKRIYFDPEETFHIRGLSSDGFWGLSVVKVAQNVLGHGLALQRHGNSVFKNGANPSGVLNLPGSKPNPDVVENYRSEWKRLHSGAGNVGNVAILFGEAKFQQLSMSNEDAQWIEGRRLDREFVASLFNLPAFKLNALENSAVRANVEEQNREYYSTSLSRWGQKFKEEGERKLFSPSERRLRRVCIVVKADHLTQGNRESRMNFASNGVQARLLTRNEGRAELGFNPVPDGDEFENPAIDTNASKGSSSQSDDGQPEEAARTANDLVEHQVRNLLEAEGNRLKKAAKSHAKSFVAWIDEFYDQEDYLRFCGAYLSKACQLCESFGYDFHWREASKRRASDQKERLLNILDTVTLDELVVAINLEATSVKDSTRKFFEELKHG